MSDHTVQPDATAATKVAAIEAANDADQQAVIAAPSGRVAAVGTQPARPADAEPVEPVEPTTPEGEGQ